MNDRRVRVKVKNETSWRVMVDLLTLLYTESFGSMRHIVNDVDFNAVLLSHSSCASHLTYTISSF